MQNTILTKDQLELFKFPIDKKKISINQEIISGIKKNATQAIILSTGQYTSCTFNEATKIPYVDIRLWAMNSDTKKWVMTPKGLRLNSQQYLLFYRMLEKEFPLLSGEKGTTIISHDLDTQALNQINQQTTTT